MPLILIVGAAGLTHCGRAAVDPGELSPTSPPAPAAEAPVAPGAVADAPPAAAPNAAVDPCVEEDAGSAQDAVDAGVADTADAAAADAAVQVQAADDDESDDEAPKPKPKADAGMPKPKTPPPAPPPAPRKICVRDAGVADAGGAASTCIPQSGGNGNGHHEPGNDCLACHAQLSAGLRWTVAGTLFTDAAASSAAAGATIEAVDATGKVIRMPTSTNGNFWTTQPVTFPLRVRASRCPADVPMVAPVAQGQGSCNSCHNATLRMHL